MGKNLIQQRRGRGTKTYSSPSFRFKGEVVHYPVDSQGRVVDLIHCAGHSAPLMAVSYNEGDMGLHFAPEGIKVGDKVSVCSIRVGGESESEGDQSRAEGPRPLSIGDVAELKDIVEGTLIHNIELKPGDGGKMVRASGVFAKVVAKSELQVRIVLPSKKEKVLSPHCRAAVGVLSGGGRPEKPFLKAGTRYHRMRARNKLYPKVCGISMNAVDHPFGGKCSHIKGRPTQSPRSAPPGRKVGKIAPRRTGRRR